MLPYLPVVFSQGKLKSNLALENPISGLDARPRALGVVSVILLELAARVPQMLRAERRAAGRFFGCGWTRAPS